MHGPDLKRFYERTRNAKKIVVVDLGFLGDTVHLVPALWEIKDHYPQAELHVLSSPLGCEVLQMVRCVVKIGNRHLLHLALLRHVRPQSKVVEEAPILLGAIGQLDDLEIGAKR